ncbi:AmmeMemoRadiSam system protein B [Amphritea balenae]|uniref:MEMO1 family protein EHS89_16280 n=1 Tax=Amphritea balenae TaxID=452629 RepID=A0A3P1SKV8_9GAMM|nr:AmmeMemoRadiSam system protein B [Amphritea balenae]RRC97736.1 AmmeMemoRadiSam system protein B [Amphritea balenae]GGK82634.1 hypothetical protein GCM10007941_36320 [Amphritea balenae]
MRIKQAAVAGMFYPDNPEELVQMVKRLLADNPQVGRLPQAILVPHAGLIYSGAIAARAYNLIRPYLNQIKRIVLLGPSHRVPLHGMAVMEADCWRTPLGDMVLDYRFSEQLVAAGLVGVNDNVHAQEHCLEVQLPFLQLLKSECSLVPILVGQTHILEVYKLIANLLQEPATLLVISSDLSHFHPYQEAREIDLETMSKISVARSDLRPQQACGCFALNGLLYYVAQHDWQAEQLAYCNSGDTAGDKNRVVGYASYAFYR